MIYKMLLFILRVSLSMAAPLQFPLLQPLGTMQQQQLALQEQLMAIQQFQAMQRFNAMPPPGAIINLPQPLLLLLPNTQHNSERFTKLNENLPKIYQPSEGIEDEDSDSVTIESGSQETTSLENSMDSKEIPMRAILLVPNNARFSLGGFISSIPFLPFEINVPDSISWIYNGISGIISGIGQSWPFNRPQSDDQIGMDMKSVWKKLKTRPVTPIVVMPMGQPMVPMGMRI